jgi:hypothetical protein
MSIVLFIGKPVTDAILIGGEPRIFMREICAKMERVRTTGFVRFIRGFPKRRLLTFRSTTSTPIAHLRSYRRTQISESAKVRDRLLKPSRENKRSHSRVSRIRRRRLRLVAEIESPVPSNWRALHSRALRLPTFQTHGRCSAESERETRFDGDQKTKRRFLVPFRSSPPLPDGTAIRGSCPKNIRAKNLAIR